jgi:hypothetical protein
LIWPVTRFLVARRIISLNDVGWMTELARLAAFLMLRDAMLGTGQDIDLVN